MAGAVVGLSTLTNQDFGDLLIGELWLGSRLAQRRERKPNYKSTKDEAALHSYFPGSNGEGQHKGRCQADSSEESCAQSPS
jgi:hypothetical protein